MKKYALIAMLTLSFASKASAKDYIALNVYIENMVEASTSLQECKRLGFRVLESEKDGRRMLNAMYTKAAFLGAPKTIADAMISSSMEEYKFQKQEMEKSWKEADDASRIEKFMRVVEHYNDRCSHLSQTDPSSEYIIDMGVEARKEALYKWADELDAMAKK